MSQPRCQQGVCATPAKCESSQRCVGWPEQMSLYEYCKVESGGLEGVALQCYINRYYGHG